MKAERNKTIDLSVEEGKIYLDRCLRATAPMNLETILDRTILGDTFSILPLLPRKFVDLLIADPPYNLDKDFNGKKFRHMSDAEYEEYTESWLKPILPLLKKLLKMLLLKIKEIPLILKLNQAFLISLKHLLVFLRD